MPKLSAQKKPTMGHATTDHFDAARSELATIRDLLRFAVSRFHEAELFFGHGSQSAYDEAAYLILHTLHLPLDRLEPFLDAKLTAQECDAVVAILERRVKERIPAAYLTHEAWLGDHRFYVDERTIVPRSFIAELLREDMAPWIADAADVSRVLDMCTGSGCLAILAALSFPQADVDAVDYSQGALDVAARNVADYALESRVRLLHSDMFTALDQPAHKGAKYDLIISNPPYVTGESMSALPDEYRCEPEMALASGPDGLDHVRVLFKRAPDFLREGGLLVVEVGFNREGVEAAFPQLPLTWVETSAGDEVVFLVSREDLLPAKKSSRAKAR
jgi:ribosomal protein L3 glutamine methyltransferase